jgi:hypothetical protein
MSALFRCEQHFRLVTSAATLLAMILGLTKAPRPTIAGHANPKAPILYGTIQFKREQSHAKSAKDAKDAQKSALKSNSPNDEQMNF